MRIAAKKLAPYFAGIVVALLIVVAGCNTPAPTVAYKAELGANTAVVAAMTGWGTYVALKHPPVAQEQQVKAAFQLYQQAEVALIDATSKWAATTPAPTNTPPEVVVAQAQAAATSSALVNLVTQLGATPAK